MQRAPHPNREKGKKNMFTFMLLLLGADGKQLLITESLGQQTSVTAGKKIK